MVSGEIPGQASRRPRETPASASPVRHGTCLGCGDEWTERGAIVVCPECHSLNVCEDIPL
jgi:hypothetical protein